MTCLPSCRVYFHTNGDMYWLAKLHRLLSCLSMWFTAKQAKPDNLKCYKKPATWIWSNLHFPSLTHVVWAHVKILLVWQTQKLIFFSPWLLWDVPRTLCSLFPFSGKKSTVIHLLIAWRTSADISVHPAIAARGWGAVDYLGHKW